MATKGTEKYAVVLCSVILADKEWNSRFKTPEAGKEEEGQGFAAILNSIELKGQDEPVTLRKNPTRSRHEYALVAGFNRFEAIMQIAKKSGDTAPTIKAVIKELDEEQARELNLRENVARNALSGPDLAFGIQQMLKIKKRPSTEIALSIGANQSFCAKLMRIMEGGNPSVLKSWREDPVKPTINEMDEIVKSPKGEQAALYAAAVKSKGEKVAGKNAWIATANGKAQEVGALLGALRRDGHVDILGDNFFLDAIRTLVKFKKDATEEQTQKIANSCEKAFTDALTSESDEVKTAREDKEKADKKAAKDAEKAKEKEAKAKKGDKGATAN